MPVAFAPQEHSFMNKMKRTLKIIPKSYLHRKANRHKLFIIVITHGYADLDFYQFRHCGRLQDTFTSIGMIEVVVASLVKECCDYAFGTKAKRPDGLEKDNAESLALPKVLLQMTENYVSKDFLAEELE